MGNAIAKKYDMPDQHTASAGLAQLWRLYPATQRETGREVPLWVYQKDDLGKEEQMRPDKSTTDNVFLTMRKDMITMRDLKDESNGVVKCLKVIEDTKNSLVFVTERVVCSLADLLQRFEKISGGVSTEVLSFFKVLATLYVYITKYFVRTSLRWASVRLCVCKNQKRPQSIPALTYRICHLDFSCPSFIPALFSHYISHFSPFPPWRPSWYLYFFSHSSGRALHASIF
jgi:hypothetical protein